MSRTPFDTYAKDILQALLSAHGVVESDARISAESQLADLRFVRDDARPPPPTRDFLTDGLEPKMLYEFAHVPPDVATVVSWTHKRDGWFLELRREARRRKEPLPLLPPVLCVLSAGDPVEVRRAYGMRAVVRMRGCFVGAPADTLRLVVLSRLPKTRTTLLARTMSAGATLREALKELAALPPDAPERTLAGPRIVRLRVELQRDPSPEAQETLMQTQKIYEDLMQRQLDRGVEQGIEQGIERGIEQGLRDAIEQVCVARGLRLTAAQRAKVAAETRTDTLRRWLSRAATEARATAIFSPA